MFNIEVCEQNNYPERNQQLDAGKIRESDYLKYSYNPHAHNEEHNNYEYHPYKIDEEDEKQVRNLKLLNKFYYLWRNIICIIFSPKIGREYCWRRWT